MFIQSPPSLFSSILPPHNSILQRYDTNRTHFAVSARSRLLSSLNVAVDRYFWALSSRIEDRSHPSPWRNRPKLSDSRLRASTHCVPALILVNSAMICMVWSLGMAARSLHCLIRPATDSGESTPRKDGPGHAHRVHGAAKGSRAIVIAGSRWTPVARLCLRSWCRHPLAGSGVAVLHRIFYCYIPLFLPNLICQARGFVLRYCFRIGLPY